MSTTATQRRTGVVGNAGFKAPCAAATTANITLSGEQTIDGVAIVADDRVLVKDQTTASENGIYKASTGAWTRSEDFDGTFDAVKGTMTYVNDGDTNARSFWRVTTDSPFTIGTSSITWGKSGVPSDVNTVENFTATAAQTTFTTSQPYSPGVNAVDVYQNGLRLVSGVGYTETDANTITLATGATSGDKISISIRSIVASGASFDAANVAYTPGGTGAIATSVQAWLRQFVSVVDFGATGDGSTNDRAAFQAALDTGKHVYVPTPDTAYLIGSSLTPATVGQKIFGDGAASIIRASAATFNLFVPSAADILLADLRLEGAATDATTEQYAVYTAAANPAVRLRLNRVVISGPDSSTGFNNGVKYDTDSDYGSADQIYIERLRGATAAKGYGILAGACSGLMVKEVVGIGSAGNGRHLVYFSAGCTDSAAEDCYAKDFEEDGFTMAATGAQDPNNRCEFRNCTADTCCVNGTTASGSISIFGHALDCKLIDCTSVSSGAKGITVDVNGETDILGSAVVGCNVRLAATVGIDYTSLTRGLIDGCIVYESSQDGAGLYSNINIRSDGVTTPDEILVTNNHSTGTTMARSPFRVDASAPAPTNIKLSGNYFPDCQLTGIELNGVAVVIDGWLRYTETYDPDADGGTNTPAHIYSGITVTGAAVGDMVLADHTGMPNGTFAVGRVTGADTVAVAFINMSGEADDIASGTLRIHVQKTDS